MGLGCGVYGGPWVWGLGPTAWAFGFEGPTGNDRVNFICLNVMGFSGLWVGGSNSGS